MEDTRRTGRSYGYVVIPQGGLSVAGLKFPEGPRAVGKSPNGGWFRLLKEAGCDVITQAEYEDELKHTSQSSSMPTEVTGQEEETDDRTGHDDRDLPAAGNRKSNRRAGGKRRRTEASPAGASAGDLGVPGN